MAIKQILFPVDFSEQNAAAAPFVRALAAKFGAEVTLISVLPPFWEPVGGMLVPGGAMPVDLEVLRSNLEHRLAGAFSTELAGVTVRRVAELGDPAQVITQYAQSEGVDLIMMPTHGYGLFRTLLLGSVASKVLHDTECPVWTATHTDQVPAMHQVDCRTIVCAVDGPLKSGPVIEWAAEFAALMKADLHLVHAVPGAPAWPERQMNQEYEAVLREKAREQIERQMQAANMHAPVHVVMGDVATVVRNEAIQHRADLVVIGRGMLDERMGRLRTHAYGIVRSAPCPVISV